MSQEENCCNGRFPKPLPQGLLPLQKEECPFALLRLHLQSQNSVLPFLKKTWNTVYQKPSSWGNGTPTSKREEMSSTVFLLLGHRHPRPVGSNSSLVPHRFILSSQLKSADLPELSVVPGSGHSRSSGRQVQRILFKPVYGAKPHCGYLSYAGQKKTLNKFLHVPKFHLE